MSDATPARKLAERIVERCFTNGAGEEATRLVLVKEDHPQYGDGYPRYLGGYCKSVLVALITRELENEEA